MMRIRQERKILRLVNRIVTARESSLSFSCGDRSALGLASPTLRSRNIAIKPPAATQAMANHRVPVSPINGMVKLGR
ncbi:hypothetical protein D3C76_1303800 [compost metagenome]